MRRTALLVSLLSFVGLVFASGCGNDGSAETRAVTVPKDTKQDADAPKVPTPDDGAVTR